jgi:hypothetical protein
MASAFACVAACMRLGKVLASGEPDGIEVSRTLVQRVHNPRNLSCGCDPQCWCRRTAIGRAVKWWLPARWFGIHHQNRVFDGMSRDEIREWKRRQALR